jgi:methionyl-tRNA formyltransferase
MVKPSVIFLGAKPGSVVALSVMLERGWYVRQVVASRKFDYPWLQHPTLREFALDRGLSVAETQQELQCGEVDFVISYSFRYRVTSETRRLARRAALNFHAGPLPEFGGWAFYNVAILEDVAEYGCTCHHMDEGFDSGPLVKVRRFPINASVETAQSLEAKTQIEMIKLFCEFCALAESGAELPREEQDPRRVRYMTRDEFEALKAIPADAGQGDIERRARAFWYPPYQGAYIKIGNNTIEVVPSLEKVHLAVMLHANELAALRQAVREFCAREDRK